MRDYDSWLSDGPWNEYQFKCPECGSPVEEEHQLCSGVCFEASML